MFAGGPRRTQQVLRVLGPVILFLEPLGNPGRGRGAGSHSATRVVSGDWI